jgi:pyruvate formate lyase activating enzyme
VSSAVRQSSDAVPLMGRWQTALPDGRLRCEVCPRHCLLSDGQAGWCQARLRRGMALEVHAPPGAIAVDPIEKKPLFHFLPGTSALSVGTPGCNLACRFCQNWELSRAVRPPLGARHLEPSELVLMARRSDCRSVAFTYSEPLVVTEWVLEAAAACREAGIRTVAVTAGYAIDPAREAFFSAMDAANVDLKGFSEDFYRRYCGAQLRPVLETLEYLRGSTRTWLEVTTLLIPGLNDSERMLGEQFEWCAATLGAAVPLHLSAFHPAHRMLQTPPTPVAVLQAARRRALQAGLNHVYVGNCRDPEGETTWCSGCKEPLLRRCGVALIGGQLQDGRCGVCGCLLAGIFD